MPAPSTDKTLKLILSSIEAGDYYSAHLKARSTVARLVNAKSSESDAKTQEAINLLFTSAQALLRKGQAGSGSDLALYLIEVWTLKNVECGTEERSIITQLIALMDRSENWRNNVITAALNWTAKTGTNPAGDALLHAYIGELLYKEKDFAAAEPHLLASQSKDSARNLAAMLYDWSLLDGHKTDGAGRYAARGVFSYLEASCILGAETFLTHFLSLLFAAQSQLLQEKVPLPSGISDSAHSDLSLTKLSSLNFLQLVILNCQAGVGTPLVASPSIQKGAGRQAWLALWNRYEREATWLRSQPMKDAKEVLGELYFGIKVNKGGENIMASLVQNLFGGGGSASTSSRPAPGRVISPGLD